jgi:isopentenyl diphosphate isomerase/L-lactate dehydrogenase-like FMN-dependent dehydrogenase
VNEFVDLVARQVAADLRAAPGAARRRFTDEGRAARCNTIDDLRAMAKRTVPQQIFDYVDGAAWDEVTVRRNRTGFERFELLPRMLVDASEIEMSTTALGREIALPVIGAPTGMTGLNHPDGEGAIARAAHAVGTIYTQSALSSLSIEEVSAVAPGPKWFQLYVMTDRGIAQEMLARAAAAGYEALVLTVDVAVAGVRERDVRNRFSVPPRLTLKAAAQGVIRPRWSRSFIARPRLTTGNVTYEGGGALSHAQWVNRSFDPSMTWDDIAMLREHWGGPLLIKGIMRPDDAVRAVEHGVEGIIVSNHGGRQLDHAQSSIEALPAIAEAVAGRAELYLDSGIRRGTDIITALALGARAVLIGRPLVYGLGAAGEAGARRAFELLRGELATALALAGYPRISELGPDAIHVR